MSQQYKYILSVWEWEKRTFVRREKAVFKSPRPLNQSHTTLRTSQTHMALCSCRRNKLLDTWRLQGNYLWPECSVVFGSKSTVNKDMFKYVRVKLCSQENQEQENVTGSKLRRLKKYSHLSETCDNSDGTSDMSFIFGRKIMSRGV